MVLTKNRKPTLSPKTIFQVKVDNHKTFLICWLYLNLLVMMTTQKSIFCLRTIFSSLHEGTCLHFHIKLTKIFFQKLRAVKKRSSTQFFIAELCKTKDDQDQEDVTLCKPLVKQAMKRSNSSISIEEDETGWIFLFQF